MSCDLAYLRMSDAEKLLSVNDQLNGLRQRYVRFKNGEGLSRSDASEVGPLIDLDAETPPPSSTTSANLHPLSLASSATDLRPGGGSFNFNFCCSLLAGARVKELLQET